MVAAFTKVSITSHDIRGELSYLTDSRSTQRCFVSVVSHRRLCFSPGMDDHTCFLCIYLFYLATKSINNNYRKETHTYRLTVYSSLVYSKHAMESHNILHKYLSSVGKGLIPLLLVCEMKLQSGVVNISKSQKPHNSNCECHYNSWIYSLNLVCKTILSLNMCRRIGQKWLNAKLS